MLPNSRNGRAQGILMTSESNVASSLKNALAASCPSPNSSPFSLPGPVPDPVAEFAWQGRDPQPLSREGGEVPQLTVVHATPYMTGQARDPSVPSVLWPPRHAAGPLNKVAIRHEDAADAAGMVSQRRSGSPVPCHPRPRIWVAKGVQAAGRAEGLGGESPANRWWTHVDSNQGPLPYQRSVPPWTDAPQPGQECAGLQSPWAGSAKAAVSRARQPASS